jgi:hypothetical protein
MEASYKTPEAQALIDQINRAEIRYENLHDRIVTLQEQERALEKDIRAMKEKLVELRMSPIIEGS